MDSHDRQGLHAVCCQFLSGVTTGRDGGPGWIDGASWALCSAGTMRRPLAGTYKKQKNHNCYIELRSEGTLFLKETCMDGFVGSEIWQVSR